MEEPIPDQQNAQPNPDRPKPRKRGTNVPISIVTGIICLGLGIAGGVVLAEYVGDHSRPAAAASGDGDDPRAKGGDTPKGMPGGGKGGKAPGGGKGDGGGNKGGNKGGGPGGGAPGGGFGGPPSPKLQLVQLISKLDVLTAKPLTVELTPEQRKQTKELLSDLESKDRLSDEEAQAKLTALLKLVEGNKQALKDAGYLWPGEAGAGNRGAAPTKEENIFRSAPNADRLKSLQSTLGK